LKIRNGKEVFRLAAILGGGNELYAGLYEIKADVQGPSFGALSVLLKGERKHARLVTLKKARRAFL
jgi:hypothetical protein